MDAHLQNQLAGVIWAMENAHIIQIFIEPDSPKVPDFVRKSWIGMILPALPAENIKKISTDLPDETGYYVEAKSVIDKLEGRDQLAANWWKKNLSSENPWLHFDQKCCMRLGV